MRNRYVLYTKATLGDRVNVKNPRKGFEFESGTVCTVFAVLDDAAEFVVVYYVILDRKTNKNKPIVISVTNENDIVLINTPNTSKNVFN